MYEILLKGSIIYASNMFDSHLHVPCNQSMAISISTLVSQDPYRYTETMLCLIGRGPSRLMQCTEADILECAAIFLEPLQGIQMSRVGFRRKCMTDERSNKCTIRFHVLSHTLKGGGAPEVCFNILIGTINPDGARSVQDDIAVVLLIIL